MQVKSSMNLTHGRLSNVKKVYILTTVRRVIHTIITKQSALSVTPTAPAKGCVLEGERDQQKNSLDI